MLRHSSPSQTLRTNGVFPDGEGGGVVNEGAVPHTMLRHSSESQTRLVPQTMLSHSSPASHSRALVPQTTLSHSAPGSHVRFVPQATLSQSAPSQSVPHTTLS